MPIPKKGSIPGRKQPIGLSDLLGGAENLLGNLLAEIVKGLGKTIKEVQNLNLEDLLKLAETQGNKEAKRNIQEIEKKLEEKGIADLGKGLDLKKLIDLVAKHGIVQFGARGHVLGKEFGGDLPLDRRKPQEKFTVKRYEPKVQPGAQKIRKIESEREMQPNLDVFDEKDFILITGDMPGVNEEEIKHKIEGNLLTIWTEGNRKYRKEIELSVPVTEEVNLKYRNGVLEIKLTKKVN